MLKTKKFRRLLAGLLAVLMLSVCLPVGAFAAESTGNAAESQSVTVTVTMNIQFKNGDEVVAGGDYTVPAGVQNYSVLEQYVPAGYQMTASGDFMAEAGGKLVVNIEKISTDVIMNVVFVYNDESVGGGDYFLPEGVQNYSILNQYVPEGYKLAVSGDFMVTAGASENVRVEPLNDEIIVNIQFEDRYGNVIAGGDYFVPAGIQNRTVLDEYVPNGYVQAVTGDIEFVAGQHYDIVLDEGTSIVNIQFIDRDGNVIAGGDYFVPTGIHNRTVLDQYVPEGYRQCVTGDIQFIYGYHYEIIIELIPEEVVTKTAIFRKAEGDTWNENLDNPDEVHYTFWSDDTDATCIVPSITAGDETKELDYWVSEIDETVILVPGEEFCYNDLDKGELEGCVGDFAFYPVYKDVQTEEPTKPSDPSTGDNTTTVTGKDEHPDIAEAKANGTWGAPTATPAAASTIPQTGDSMPVVMLIVIALAAAGAVGGLVVLRKRSHQ